MSVEKATINLGGNVVIGKKKRHSLDYRITDPANEEKSCTVKVKDTSINHQKGLMKILLKTG